jgi:hypothetical protein
VTLLRSNAGSCRSVSISQHLQELTQYDAMRICARAIYARSMAEQNGERRDVAISSACNGGWIIDPVLLRAVNQIGPVRCVL